MTSVVILRKSCYGSTERHLSREAWELSRSPDDETPLRDILAIDAPVNELPSVVLNITTSVLGREIMTTPRDHVMWARTSRVDDPSNMIPDTEVKSYLNFNKTLFDFWNYRDEMRRQKAKGVPQDQYRMGLLFGAMTSFTTTINLRSLTKLILELRDLVNLYDHLNPLKELERQLTRVLNECSEENAEHMLSKYKKTHYLRTAISFEDSASTDNYLVVNVDTNWALRAQAVRHRTFHIVDNFYTDIIQNKNCWITPIGAPCRMSIGAPKDVWVGILSKRLCWIAQHDIWKPVIDAASMILTDTEKLLPCSNGICPYARDAQLRYTDEDPGNPCPRYSLLNNVPMTNDQYMGAHKEAEGRPYWRDQLMKVLTKGLAT